jgi:hypothetical protein
LQFTSLTSVPSALAETDAELRWSVRIQSSTPFVRTDILAHANGVVLFHRHIHTVHGLVVMPPSVVRDHPSMML